MAFRLGPNEHVCSLVMHHSIPHNCEHEARLVAWSGLQDMAPYVGLLMPELQAAVVDPLPEVRATAARALGSLLRGMGAEHFSDLVPWLLATLRSEVWMLRGHTSLPWHCKALCIISGSI